MKQQYLVCSGDCNGVKIQIGNSQFNPSIPLELGEEEAKLHQHLNTSLVYQSLIRQVAQKGYELARLAK
jgi:hypothetical protein